MKHDFADLNFAFYQAVTNTDSKLLERKFLNIWEKNKWKKYIN